MFYFPVFFPKRAKYTQPNETLPSLTMKTRKWDLKCSVCPRAPWKNSRSFKLTVQLLTEYYAERLTHAQTNFLSRKYVVKVYKISCKSNAHLHPKELIKNNLDVGNFNFIST